MELRLLAAALRRRLTVIVLAALAGVAVAALLLTSQSSTYRATASLLLDPLAVTTPLGQPFTGDPERYIGGQMRILQGQELAQAAARNLPGETAASLSRSVSVTHTVGSDLVDVTAESDRPSRARALANAVVETYVAQRRAETAAQTKAVVDQVDGELAAVQASLNGLRGTGAGVEAQRQLQLQQYQQALDRKREVTAPGATRDATRVLDLAPLPPPTQRLPRAATLAVGGLGGAVLMLGGAVLAEALRPRVTHRRQVERMLRTPVLTAFSRASRRPIRQDRVVNRLLPQARTLAALVALTPQEGKRRVVGVCGATPGAGTTTIATALAVAFAEQGSNVVLVHSGKGQRLPGSPEAAPYQSHGSNGSERGDWVVVDDTLTRAGGSAGVSTATWQGGRPPRAEDVVAIVDELPAVHDVVVLDLPPVLRSPLPAAVTSWVQDVVMVVRLPEELERDVELAHGMLASTRPDLRLVVTPNSTPRSRSRLS